MVLVVDFPHLHDAGGALLGCEDMEVEQHHLAFQVGKPAYVSLVVGQGNVYHASILHLRGVDGLRLLCLKNADVLQSLYGYVVQVQPALGFRIVCVPACCHGSEHLYVVLVAAWIEYQGCVIAQGHRLEQGEIAVCPHGLLEDVVVLHLLLVYGKNSTDGVANVVGVQSAVGYDAVDIGLQRHLPDGELLYLRAVVRACHLIVRCHGRVGGFHCNLADGVSGNVDNLVCYTETIELRCLRGIDGEIERAVLVQSYGVYNYGSVEAHVLEIE